MFESCISRRYVRGGQPCPFAANTRITTSLVAPANHCRAHLSLSSFLRLAHATKQKEGKAPVNAAISLVGGKEIIEHEDLVNTTKPANLFFTDIELRALTWGIPRAFYDEFANGFAAYKQGEWEVAQHHLTEATKIFPKEKHGPSKTILAFMRTHGFAAPLKWEGYRALNEK